MTGRRLGIVLAFDGVSAVNARGVDTHVSRRGRGWLTWAILEINEGSRISKLGFAFIVVSLYRLALLGVLDVPRFGVASPAGLSLSGAYIRFVRRHCWSRVRGAAAAGAVYTVGLSV